MPDLSELPDEVAEKLENLRAMMRELDSVVVVFSGGVDSSLVAFVAHEQLRKKALAVTSGSDSLKRDDLDLTKTLTDEWGMAHRTIQTEEMKSADYRANPANRCYFCKTTLYQDLRNLADQEGYAHVLNGVNLDDQGDHRPGLIAAKEHHVLAPLTQCGFRKDDIRKAAAYLGIKTANKPQAACLASRIPYGTAVSPALLNKIEKAEQVLKQLGFSQYRVRHHGAVARVELPEEELEIAVKVRSEMTEGIKACGYQFVALDLVGFKSGSLNYALSGDGIPSEQ